MRRKLFERTLSQGSANDPVAVLALQTYLIGLIAPRYRRGLVADGEYGPKTVDAVNVLRRRLGLETNGRFGPQLKAALEKGSSKWKIGRIDFDAIEVRVDEVVVETASTTPSETVGTELEQRGDVVANEQSSDTSSAESGGPGNVVSTTPGDTGCALVGAEFGARQSANRHEVAKTSKSSQDVRDIETTGLTYRDCGVRLFFWLITLSFSGNN